MYLIAFRHVAVLSVVMSHHQSLLCYILISLDCKYKHMIEFHAQPIISALGHQSTQTHRLQLGRIFKSHTCIDQIGARAPQWQPAQVYGLLIRPTKLPLKSVALFETPISGHMPSTDTVDAPVPETCVHRGESGDKHSHSPREWLRPPL
jgi:hypothetical protein